MLRVAVDRGMHEGGGLGAGRIDGNGGEEAGAAQALLTEGAAIGIEEQQPVGHLQRRTGEQGEGVLGHEAIGRDVTAIEELVGEGF